MRGDVRVLERYERGCEESAVMRGRARDARLTSVGWELMGIGMRLETVGKQMERNWK